MRNFKRRIALSAAVIALASVLTVAPTYAWLTSSSEEVVNTFVSGAVMIKLDQAAVDSSGKADPTKDRVIANQYRYVAGAIYDQDPTVTIQAGSEECYVFMSVVNELPDSFAINWNTTAWEKVETEGNATLWMHRTTPNAMDSAEDIVLEPIFTTVTSPTSLTAEDARELDGRSIRVKSFAIQKYGVSLETAIQEAKNKLFYNISTSHPEVEKEETGSENAEDKADETVQETVDQPAVQSAPTQSEQQESAAENTSAAEDAAKPADNPATEEQTAQLEEEAE